MKELNYVDNKTTSVTEIINRTNRAKSLFNKKKENSAHLRNYQFEEGEEESLANLYVVSIPTYKGSGITADRKLPALWARGWIGRQKNEDVLSKR